MDLLTAAENRVETVSTLRRDPCFAGLALYSLIVAGAIVRHEPWADEAQSWLLARDAGLIELWTRLLHYEGTTGLWQTLLHAAIRAGLPYAGMNVVTRGYRCRRLGYYPLAIAISVGNSADAAA